MASLSPWCEQPIPKSSPDSINCDLIMPAPTAIPRPGDVDEWMRIGVMADPDHWWIGVVCRRTPSIDVSTSRRERTESSLPIHRTRDSNLVMIPVPVATNYAVRATGEFALEFKCALCKTCLLYT